MTLDETKPKAKSEIAPYDPIPFNNDAPAQKLGNIATTTAGDEIVAAELALIKPSADAAGVVLGMKLRMSPRDHVGPTKISIPMVVLPEGASIFDKRNARWTTIEVDLGFVYEEGDR
jgi:hypothetical protein